MTHRPLSFAGRYVAVLGVTTMLLLVGFAPNLQAQHLQAQKLPAQGLPSPVNAGLTESITQAAEAAGASAQAANALATAATVEISEDQKLTASDGEAGDRFAYGVSMSGDRALIGVTRDDDLGVDAGAAYIFDFDGATWNETAKLTASDGATGDNFGWTVSLDGDRALISAPDDDDVANNAGAAYIFDFDGTTWNETAKLTASDGVANDAFSFGASLSGDRALIGSPESEVNSISGSAYIFDFDGTTWNETAKLIASDGDGGDSFGRAVSLDGDRALIGNYTNDDDGSNSGSAYIFDFDGTTWNETAKLTASDAAAADFLGWSVSLDGDRALLSAHGDDDNGSTSGSAYVFDFDGTTWNETAKLTASDGAGSDAFGLSVSLSGDRVLIGAPSDDDNGSNSGSAYVFDFDGNFWNETAKLTASDGAMDDRIGFPVAQEDTRMFIGTWKKNNDTGAAYVMTVPFPSPISASTSTTGGWRLLSVPVDATVAHLTPLNLVGGVQSDPLCDNAAEGEPLTLFTHYNGGQTPGGNDGYTLPTSYDENLLPGDGFWWYFYSPPEAAPSTCGDSGERTASSAQPLPITLSLSGLPTSEDRQITISGRVANDDPFYMAGNAFTRSVDLGESALSFVSAEDDNGQSVALQNTVQIYDPDLQGYTDLVVAGDGGGSGGGDDLEVWRGAWVERSSATSPAYPLTLTYAASSQIGAPNLAPPATTQDGVTLRRLGFELRGAVSDKRVFDGAASIHFAAEAHHGWDAWDASKLAPQSSPFALLAPVGNDRNGALTQKAAESRALEIQAGPDGRTTDIPMAFYTSGAGTFSLTWPEMTGFPETWELQLRDVATATTVDLRSATSYDFEAEASETWTERFVITATAPSPIDAEASPEQRPEAFALSPVYPNPAPLASEARVRISLAAEATVRLEVFDVLGRRLAPAATSRLAGGREQELAVPTGSLPAGSYVLRVTQSGAEGTSVQVRRFTVVR